MLVSAIYNLVDTFFVGMLNDNGAMGAVSIAFPIFMVVVAVGQTMGVGSGAYISRLLGGKNIDEAKRVAMTSIITFKCAVTNSCISQAIYLVRKCQVSYRNIILSKCVLPSCIITDEHILVVSIIIIQSCVFTNKNGVSGIQKFQSALFHRETFCPANSEMNFVNVRCFFNPYPGIVIII